MKAVLFDMDGTMLKTENIAIPAFQMTFAELRKRGLYSGETPSEEKFLKQLGNTLEAIWETILPNTDWETRLLADRIMLESELEIIRSGGLTFFPGVEDTLRLLKKKGYDLFVASNGLENYISAIVEHSGFGELFTDLYSAGRFQTKTKWISSQTAQRLSCYNRLHGRRQKVRCRGRNQEQPADYRVPLWLWRTERVRRCYLYY